MKRFTGVFAVLGTLAALQFSGCMKNNTLEPFSTDQQYFMSVVGGNESDSHDLLTSDQDALNDGETFGIAQKSLPPSIQSSLIGNPIVPQKWGRVISSVSRTITRTDASGDTVAVVRFDVSYTGNFVIIGTVNGVLDTVYKPFTLVGHRLLRFARIANTMHMRMNWRLDAISVVNGGTTNAQVTIQKVQVVPPSGDTIVATDPDNYWMQVTHGWMHHPIPLWGYHSQVTVIVTEHSTDVDSDWVVLHYAPGPNVPGVHRAAMTLVSSTPDPTGFTRVYSITFTIPNNARKFSHLVVSATTSGSLYSATATDFSNSIWGIPYKTSE